MTGPDDQIRIGPGPGLSGIKPEQSAQNFLFRKSRNVVYTATDNISQGLNQPLALSVMAGFAVSEPPDC